MRIHSSTLVCALLVIAAGAPACSSDKGGGGTFSTGIPRSTVIGSLTPSQAQQVCQASGSYFAGNIAADGECKGEGFGAALFTAGFDSTATDTDLQNACSSAQSLCEKGGSQPLDAGTSSTSSCTPPPSDCTATIGEYEDCLNDAHALLVKETASIPACNTLTRSELKAAATPTDGGGASVTSPPSCTALQAKCPSLNTGSGASISSGALGPVGDDAGTINNN
jgi:hypothetical protein